MTTLAQTPEQMDQVFRIRYECYRRDGSIDPLRTRRFRDAFDELPNSFSFLQADCNQPVSYTSTVRLTAVRPENRDWRDSPALHVFSDVARLQEIAEASYVEASRLCFCQTARRDSFVRLVGHMAALGEFLDVDWLVACPRIEHSHSYKRLFGFDTLAAPRQYFGVRFQTELLAIRVADLRSFIRGRGPLENAWKSALTAIHGTSFHCVKTHFELGHSIAN